MFFALVCTDEVRLSFLLLSFRFKCRIYNLYVKLDYSLATVRKKVVTPLLHSLYVIFSLFHYVPIYHAIILRLRSEIQLSSPVYFVIFFFVFFVTQPLAREKCLMCISRWNFPHELGFRNSSYFCKFKSIFVVALELLFTFWRA